MAFVKPRAILQRGTRAAQPAATAVAVGTLYFCTDVADDSVQRSNGTTWDTVIAATGAGWTSVAHGSLTFSAATGTWTVASGDLAYFKFKKEGSHVFLKGAIITSSVSATPTELRVTVPGVTFTGNDSFGFTVLSQDGFATQDTGQSICRTSSGLLVFKPRAGGNWLTTADLTAVIWNLVGECSA